MLIKNILVIGGAGYIGTACVKSLCDNNYTVTVFDNLSHGQRGKVDSRAKFVHGDILNEEDLNRCCSGHHYDAVIHLAALKSVEDSEKNPSKYFKHNVAGLINVLTAMETYEIPKIVFSSTASVYKPNESGVYTENSEIGAVNVYGDTKIIAEKIIQDFARAGKIKSYGILRYFNVAGDFGLDFKEEDAKNIFPILAETLNDGSIFNIFSDDYDTLDGTCVRDYIHIADIVDAHMKALEYNKSGLWNLGTKVGTTVHELLEAFEKISKKKIKWSIVSRRAGDPAKVVADASKAEKELAWQARYSLDDMVESTLKVYKT